MILASEEQKEKEVPVKTVTVLEKVSKGDSKSVEKVQIHLMNVDLTGKEAGSPPEDQ